MSNISPDELKQLSLLLISDPYAALQLLFQYEQIYSTDSSWLSNHGGFLIDIGSALNDRDVVQRGIDSLLLTLQSPTLDNHPMLLYNIATGYSVLHSIDRNETTFSFNPDATPLINAKRYFREALTTLQAVNPELQAQIHINYGNCLEHIGRFVEAIQEYDNALSIMNNHPMAWGNLGMGLLQFSSIVQSIDLLQDAKLALVRALASPDLEQIGDPISRSSFEDALRKIEYLLANITEQDPNDTEDLPNHSSYHSGYVAFCMRHQLLLNFCLKKRPCSHPSEDNIGFSITTNIHDNTTFPKLSRISNELKERFATARLLLYESCYPAYEIQSYDLMTHYVENKDYAVYGISVAKMKLAFESAYNILDKIAFFIDSYFNLNISAQRINFTSIWKEQRSNTLRDILLQTNNYQLYGLYDLSRELTDGGRYSHLRKIRNYTTHRYLTPHTESMGWITEADSPEYHLQYRELSNHTIELMHIVRSAVIYLIACIDQEEQRKRTSSTGLVLPFFVNRYRPYYPDNQL